MYFYKFLIFIFISYYGFAAELKIGFDGATTNKYSQKEMTIASEVWIKSIVKEMDGHTSSQKIYDSSKELADGFKKGEVNYITAYGYDIIKYFDKSLLVPSFLGTYKDREDTYYIIVSQAKYENNWKKLLNPKIGIVKDDKIQKIYLNYNLLKENRKIDIDYKEFNKASQILLNLFFGKIDMGIVPYRSYKTAIELNPQMKQKISLIKKSDISSVGFGFFHKNIPIDIRDDFINKVMNLNQSNSGKQLLAIYKMDILKMTDLYELKSIEDLINRYEKFLKESK